MKAAGLRTGSPVVLHLSAPKEQLWGVLLSVEPSGIAIRGLDIATFEDWLLQEVRDSEPLIGPATLFYPMHRVERLEVDETIGPVTSYADRLVRETGRELLGLLGLQAD